MNGYDLLELIGAADPAYIESADNDFAAKKPRIKWHALAACLCLALAVGMFAVLYKYTKTNIVTIENIREISDKYNGTLLAENLDLSDGYSPSIELRCSGGLDDPSSWKSLSVSAKYPDCAVVLNCSFDGHKNNSDISSAIDFVEYGDILVAIYLEEPTPTYEYVHRAVFEWGGAAYELSAQSNDPERIYELLDRLVGDKVGFGSFKNILGFSGCKVKVEETSPHFFTWYFYTETSGETRYIAEMFGRFDDNMPEAYNIDLDGDGTDELVCNCVSGDGWQTVTVYRNNNGSIEAGCIRREFYDDLGAMNFGPGSFAERYDPERGFVITYYTESPDEADDPERKTATFKGGLENFDFYPYVP